MHKETVLSAKSNRQRLLSTLPSSCTLILFSAEKKQRNHDVCFPFRQESNFFWLTGWEEGQAVMVLQKNNTESVCTLFHPGLDPKVLLWEGRGYDHEQSKDVFMLDDVYADTELKGWLKKHLRPSTPILLSSSDPRATALAQELGWPSEIISDCANWIMPLRLLKTKQEQQWIQQAVDISVEAQQRVIAQSRQLPLTQEYQVAALFQYHCQLSGANGLAYPTIAAAGANACVLHYTHNQDEVGPKDCILLDAGCEWNNYAADLTRVWPVSGKFSAEQKALYEAVLATQQQCIDQVKPGVRMADLHTIARDLLTQYLCDLKIIRTSVTEAIEKRLYTDFFPHGLGHALGLDVHDPSPESKQWVLAADQVLTIEPGLYIPTHATQVDERFRGIGIRIEDNIRVTKTGCEVMSTQLPKEISAIEALAQGE